MTSVLSSLLLSSSGFQLKNAFHRFKRHDIDFATGDIFSPSQLTCTLLHPLVRGKISSGGLPTLNLLPWIYLMLQSCFKAHSSITEEKEMTVEEDIP